MSHYTLGAHQAHVSQQYISDLLLVNHIITPHYRNLLCPLQILNDSNTGIALLYVSHITVRQTSAASSSFSPSYIIHSE